MFNLKTLCKIFVTILLSYPKNCTNLFNNRILNELRRVVYDCAYGKTFKTIEELIKHLKFRFTSKKNYFFYYNKINELRMKRGETIGDFYDRLNILLEGTQDALDEEKQQNQDL